MTGPMAFTIREFVRGALSAWGIYLGLSTLCFGVIFPLYGFFYAPLWSVPWSAAALVVFAVPAYVLGWLLRNQPRATPHIWSFALFGALVGAVTTLAADSAMASTGFGGMRTVLLAVNVGTGALAVVLGWRRAARHLLPTKVRRGVRRAVDGPVEEDVIDRW